MRIFRPLNQDYKDRCKAFIDTLPPHYEIVVREYKSKRNSAQNKLLWATYNEIADLTGKSADAWHWWFKCNLIGYDEVEVNGEVTKLPHSTTRLDVKEFSDYVTRVQAWAAENLGVI